MGYFDGEVAPRICVHSSANNGRRFMSLLTIASKMEDELSDAVARFVLEAGGIEQGMYLTT